MKKYLLTTGFIVGVVILKFVSDWAVDYLPKGIETPTEQPHQDCKPNRPPVKQAQSVIKNVVVWRVAPKWLR